MKNSPYYLLLITGLILLYCSEKKNIQTDTATYGEINIAADESFKPLVDAQLGVFLSEYYNAKINTSYVSEGLAYQKLLHDSVRLIVVSRLPNENELNYFKNHRIIPKINTIALDAVAIVVAKQNKDSLLTMPQLAAIINGNIQNWGQINIKNTLGKITVVLDNNNSSNLQLIKSTFGLTTFTSNVAAAGSNEKVIDFLQTNPNAIGIIGANWISDIDDPSVKTFLNKIRIVAIASKANPSKSDYISPYQGEVFLKNYPLCRNIYTISREAKTGLGTGLNAFIMGERGQRIILKAGLVPAIMPYREVVIKKGMP